jgi:large subunit ribosomal protein L1
MRVEEAIKQLRESKKRKFSQTFDLIINLGNIDLKKPENKFSKNVILPHGRGKDISVSIVSDRIPDAITKMDLEGMKKDKIKELVERNEFFICEAPLMPLVGKVLGRYLGPKGKMPTILPPGADPNKMVGEAKKSVRIKVRDSPVIYVTVGTEAMEDDQIKENVSRVVEETKKSLPGKVKIRSVLLKLTMSKPVKLD